MNLAVVVLAAGKSTRFKSVVPKILHPLGERPMLHYTLTLAEALASEPPVVVVGPETEAEVRAWAGDRARLVVQQERLGTGHAMLQAAPLLQGQAEQILVLYGDMPLLRETTLRTLLQRQRAAEATLTILTVQRDNPRGFGRIVRDAAGHVQAIVEDIEASPEIQAIRELNTGIYTFAADFLWAALPQIQPSPRKGEYYLTDLVALAAATGHEIATYCVPDATEGLGINTRVDLAVAEAVLRQRINEQWMLAGVTLLDPATTYIGPEVTIGTDTVIHPNTHLRGRTTIGEQCQIGPNAIVEACVIGNRCRVLASVLEQAVMEDDSNIGPFSHLRKGAHLGRGAHVGNFGEMKNSTLGPGSKMGHFSYLGDAEVGPDVNIGAGTITCNYDGVRKHRTVIEKGVFIGSDTMLVAPVHVGVGAKTAAGAVVTHDVPPHTLVMGVPARVRRTLEAPPPPPDEQSDPTIT